MTAPWPLFTLSPGKRCSPWREAHGEGAGGGGGGAGQDVAPPEGGKGRRGVSLGLQGELALPMPGFGPRDTHLRLMTSRVWF